MVSDRSFLYIHFFATLRLCLGFFIIINLICLSREYLTPILSFANKPRKPLCRVAPHGFAASGIVWLHRLADHNQITRRGNSTANKVSDPVLAK